MPAIKKPDTPPIQMPSRTEIALIFAHALLSAPDRPGMTASPLWTAFSLADEFIHRANKPAE